MKIGKVTAFAAVLLIMLGGVIIASGLGLFDTESSKSAAAIKTGEFEGKADPNDIRGSFSFADISRQFGVEAAALAAAFGIEGKDEEISAFQLKGLEEKYAGLPQEIGTSSVRLFVGFMTGLPVELGAYIPLQAADIIRRSASGLTEERLAYLESHTIDLAVRPAGTMEGPSTGEAAGDPAVAQDEAGSKTVGNSEETASQQSANLNRPEPAVSSITQSEEQEVTSGELPDEAASPGEVEPSSIREDEPIAATAAGDAQASQEKAADGQAASSEEHATKKEDRTVKGNTTIFDMMSWGVSRELIGPAIGLELPKDNGAKLKDLISAAGKSFEDAKVILQKMVDESN